MEELEDSGLLPGELRARWRVRDERGGEGNHGCARECRQLAQFLSREGRLERATPSDDGYVANDGTAQDVEDWHGDVVLFEDAWGCKQHPCDVERDVALADDRHVLRPV